jgi:hypothetical protein
VAERFVHHAIMIESTLRALGSRRDGHARFDPRQRQVPVECRVVEADARVEDRDQHAAAVGPGPARGAPDPVERPRSWTDDQLRTPSLNATLDCRLGDDGQLVDPAAATRESPCIACAQRTASSPTENDAVDSQLWAPRRPRCRRDPWQPCPRSPLRSIITTPCGTPSTRLAVLVPAGGGGEERRQPATPGGEHEQARHAEVGGSDEE